MKTLKLEVDQDGIALASIDLPGRPMNVLAPELLDDLDALLDELKQRDDIKGVILTSGKSSGFIAGADLKELVSLYDEGRTATQLATWATRVQRLYRRLETCGKPVAAAINGLALGGGLELALACHYRVLADDPKCFVGLPEVNVGLLPGAGGTQRLPRLIGIAKALPLILNGNHVKPADALALGIVHAVAPAARLVELAREWMRAKPSPEQAWDRKGFQIPGGAGPMAAHATQSFMLGTAAVHARTGGNWPAPKAILSAVYEGCQVPIDVALRIETKYFAILLAHPVARNLMRTMFINKGAADKLSRRPKNIAKSQVRKMGILGAGMMGGGIAYCAAAAGIDVVLLDADRQTAEQGKAYSARLLQRAVERGQRTPEQMNSHLARIAPTQDYRDLAGCDLVVEAVSEDRAVKAEVTARAEEVIGPQAVFASNTSTLMITSLAAKSVRPQNFIGMHFFSPADRMPLVEVILGKQTSAETLARVLDLVGQLKKTPIVVNDGPAFYTTRVYCTYVDEALQMVGEGISPALIENAAKSAGMPVGPLAVIDETTQELRWRVVKQARADGLPERFAHPPGVGVLEAMCEKLDRRGRRFGGGFYDYPEGGKKRLWAGLGKHYPVKALQPDVELVKKRLLYVQALEAARCFEEGVLTEAPDGDLGSILGVGYPTWTGGTLSFIDTVGIKRFVGECDALAKECGQRFSPSPWLRQRAERDERFYPA